MHNVGFKKILVETLNNVGHPTRCPQPLNSVRLMVSYIVRCLHNDFFKPTLCKGGVPVTCVPLPTGNMGVAKPIHERWYRRLLQESKVLFCRVCGFQVRVWESYRTSKSFVRVWMCYRTHKSSGHCGTGVHNSQKFRAGTKSAVPVPRVLWHAAYRAYRSSGYGYEFPTKLTEVPGTGMRVSQNFEKFRVLWHGRTELTEVPDRYENAVPVPRVLWHGRIDLREVPDTSMNVVQNSQKFFVWVWMLYITHRSSGYG